MTGWGVWADSSQQLFTRIAQNNHSEQWVLARSEQYWPFVSVFGAGYKMRLVTCITIMITVVRGRHVLFCGALKLLTGIGG